MRIGRCAVMSDWGLRFRVLIIDVAGAVVLSSGLRQLSLLVQIRRIDPFQRQSAADRDIPALRVRPRRSHTRRDVTVGSGATRTKVLPKFSPRSISAKAVGMISSPSRISSR
jgi:hypothetical protein